MDEMKLLAFYKKCPKCGQEKEWTCFGKSNRDKFGLKYECKQCRNIVSRNYYLQNKERVKEKNYLWYSKHKELKTAQTKRFNKKHPEIKRARNKKYAACHREKFDRYRKSFILKKYGSNLNEYDRLKLEQKNLCFICGRGPDVGKALCIDHDHTRNKVRKLLCSQCNSGLGFYQDSPELLRKAADYLEMNAEKALNI